MMQMLIIEGRLDGLNEYTKANRSNRYVGASVKKSNETRIIYAIKKQKLSKTEAKVMLKFRWYEPNEKRDKDNIAFAKKFILDSLVSTRIIKSDGWKNVEGFTDEFAVDHDNPRVEVDIIEVH